MSAINPAILEAYGLKKEMSPEAVIHAMAVEKEIVESVSANTVNLQTVVSEERKRLSEDTSLTENAESFGETIAKSVWDYLESNPDTAAALVDVLQSLKQDVMDYRDFVCEQYAREKMPKIKQVSNDVDEQKEAAKQVRQFANNIFGLLSTDEIETIPTDLKKQTKDGETVLSHPSLPKGTGGGGRGTLYRRLHFVWNGEEIPVGTLPSEVAHNYMSEGATRYSWKDILSILPENEKGRATLPSAPGDKVSVNVETGTLEIYLPEETEEDSDSEK